MLKVSRIWIVVLSTSLILLNACGGGADDSTSIVDEQQDSPSEQQNNTASEHPSSPDTEDEAPAEDEDELEDEIPTIGEVDNPGEVGDRRCGNTIVEEWPLHDAMATGDVTVTNHSDYREVVIDASAGGAMGASEHPFLYFNLENGEKLQMTDLEALESDAWDIAVRRIVVRVNSGDSGSGTTTLAKIPDTTFEDVNYVPQWDDAFQEDISLDGNCNPWTDPIGNLFTAMNALNIDNPTGSGSWYAYGQGGASGIEPVQGDIYVVNNELRGQAYKLEIVEWLGGTFTIRWAPIE